MASASEQKVVDVIDAWNRGEFDAFFDWMTADVEFDMDPSWPERGPLRGDEVVTFMRGWINAWERLELVIHDVQSVGDAVVTRCTWLVRGSASGAELARDLSLVYRLDDELRLERLHARFAHEEALKAARAA